MNNNPQIIYSSIFLSMEIVGEGLCRSLYIVCSGFLLLNYILQKKIDDFIRIVRMKIDVLESQIRMEYLCKNFCKILLLRWPRRLCSRSWEIMRLHCGCMLGLFGGHSYDPTLFCLQIRVSFTK